MGRPKGSRNFAHRVRHMIDTIIENNRDEMEKKITEALLEHPVQTLMALSKYAPKEVTMDIEDNKTLTLDFSQLPKEAKRQIHELRRQSDELQRLRDSVVAEQPAALDPPGGSTG